MKFPRWMVGLFCAPFFLLAACGTDDAGTSESDGGAKAVEVTAANFAFTPVLITVDPGQPVEVTLTNEDDAQHSFTSDSLSVDLVVEGGASDLVTFDAPQSGAAEFHCKFHPTMTGTIAPQGAGGGDDAGTGSEDDLDY